MQPLLVDIRDFNGRVVKDIDSYPELEKQYILLQRSLMNYHPYDVKVTLPILTLEQSQNVNTQIYILAYRCMYNHNISLLNSITFDTIKLQSSQPKFYKKLKLVTDALMTLDINMYSPKTRQLITNIKTLFSYIS